MEQDTRGKPVIRLLGERGWLLEWPGADWPAQQRLLALADALRVETGVEEAVVGDGSLGVLFASPEAAKHGDTRLLQALEQVPAADCGGRLHDISVRYDGPDLPEVAARCGLSVSAFVEQQAGVEYRVWFTGFQPGFAYLRGLPEALRLPRRSQPRPRVPAGSLALAGEFAAIYPFASPGGWHLIGRVEIPLFDASRQPPCLLQPGDRIRFLPEALE